MNQHPVDFPFSVVEKNLLNDAQRSAILGCAQAERLGIIYGPPGTGKTTTLVSLVATLLQREKKILVSAPSNNAVDLLARKLSDSGINVLRIGNVTRIGDSIAHLCLEEKVRGHKDWQHIKQVKIEAENAKNEAAKYKRKFGPQQKRDRRAFQKEARELKKWANDLERKLVDHIIRTTQVVCTTLVGTAHPKLNGWQFETVVIDEASQALEPEAWTAMLKGLRTIMAGDHQQLPPTVKSSKAVELGFSETILDRMSPSLKECYLLNIQYRMNDKILQFSNRKFYNDKLLSADFVKNRALENDEDIVTFIDTSGCSFEEKRGVLDRSFQNEGEYFLIREHLLSLGEILDESITIGIISPYSKQVAMIRTAITEDTEIRKYNIEVNSIDGFQGQEKDVIYISLVRSNEDGNIGFLKDYRRLNVALTRARFKLIVVGDMSTLGHDQMYVDLAEYIEKVGAYKSGWEYMTMS